jgi:hypothetical protein
VAKDDKVSIGGANSNTSVYDNVQSSASCPSSSSTLAAKRNVAAYATLRGQTAAVSTATPVVANEADVVVVNDVAAATSTSTGSAAQTLTAMSATGDGGQSNCGVTATAIESKSSETQTVTTQTTKTPAGGVGHGTDTSGCPVHHTPEHSAAASDTQQHSAARLPVRRFSSRNPFTAADSRIITIKCNKEPFPGLIPNNSSNNSNNNSGRPQWWRIKECIRSRSSNRRR